MAASYEIDSDHSIVCIEYVGVMDPKTAYEIIDRMLEDPELKPGTHVISDHSRETTLARPAAVLRVMPRFVDLMRHVGARRCAVVATRAAQVGMVHLTAVYARKRGIELRPFRTREEAAAWLRGED